LCLTSGNTSKKLRTQGKNIFPHSDQPLYSILSSKERGSIIDYPKANPTLHSSLSGSHTGDLHFIM